MKIRCSDKVIALVLVILIVSACLPFTSIVSNAVVTKQVDSYDSLKEALENASSGYRVILTADAVIPKGKTLSVPSGVKLIIAYDKSGNFGGSSSADYSTADSVNEETLYTHSVSQDNAVYTLTVEEGATLDIYGGVYVGGKLCSDHISAGGDVQGKTGNLYSRLLVNGTVNISGGSLYSYGYTGGSGIIKCSAGAKVYAPFVTCSYRGGSYFYCMYKYYGLSPISEFSMPNVTVKTEYSYGSALYGLCGIRAGDSVNVCESKIIGAGEALIVFDSVDCVITTEYIPSEDYNVYYGNSYVSISGDAHSSKLSLDIYSTEVTTENLVFMIPHGINLIVKSGTFNVCHEYALLPGATLTVEKGAELLVSENGGLYMLDGITDTEVNSSAYPDSEELEAYGFTQSGTLNIYGKLTVCPNGAFAGTPACIGKEGKIEISPEAKLTAEITIGFDGKVSLGFTEAESHNKTVYQLKAGALGIDSKLFYLEAGNTYYSADENTEFTLESYEYMYYGNGNDNITEKRTGELSTLIRGSVHTEGILYTLNNGETVFTDNSVLLTPSEGYSWFDSYSKILFDAIPSQSGYYSVFECDSSVNITSEGKTENYAAADGKIPNVGLTKEHYTLSGFSLTEGGQVLFKIGDEVPSSVIYAVWEPEIYTVRFVLDEKNYQYFNKAYIEKDRDKYIISTVRFSYGDNFAIGYFSDEMLVENFYFEWDYKSLSPVEDCDVYGVYFEYGIRNLTTGSIHATLSAAVEKAANGDILKLQSDCNESTVIPADKDIVIDLNGFTLSYEGGTVLTNNGRLEITDSRSSGKIEQTAKGASSSAVTYAVANTVGAELTLSGGSIVTNIDSVNTRTVSNRGITVMSGGLISSLSGYAVYNYGSAASFVQDGGKILYSGTLSTSYAVYNYNLAEYRLNNGSIESLSSGKSFYNTLRSTLSVYGGEILSDGGVLFNNGGYVDIYGGVIKTDSLSSQTYAIQNTKSVISSELNIYGGKITAPRGARCIYNYNSTANIYSGYVGSEGSSVNAWGIYNYYLSTLNIYGGEIYSAKSHAIYNYSASSANVPVLNISGGKIVSEAGGSYYAVINAAGSKYGSLKVSGGSFISNGNYAVYSGSSSALTVVDSSAAGGIYKFSSSAFNTNTSIGEALEIKTIDGNDGYYILADNNSGNAFLSADNSYQYLAQAIYGGNGVISLIKDFSVNCPLQLPAETVIDLSGNTLSFGANTLTFSKLYIMDSVGGGRIEISEPGGMPIDVFDGEISFMDIESENDIFIGYSSDGGSNVYKSFPEKSFTLYPVFASNASFSVVFRDENGDLISEQTLSYGNTVTIPANPVKIGDGRYNYNFISWTPEVKTVCYENAEYTAVYSSVYAEYSIIFRDSYDNVISFDTCYYLDEMPEAPETPVRKTTQTEYFTFDGWFDGDGNPYDAEKPVEKDLNYTAKYTAHMLNDSYDDKNVKFDSATVLFESAMAINFRVIASDVENYELVYSEFVTVDDDGNEISTTVSNYTLNGNYMVFSFDNIAAREMGKTVKATLYAVSGNMRYCSETVEYGVRIYAERMLGRDTTSEKFKKLLIGMLDYGAASQEYFNYKTDDLVNSNITDEQRALTGYYGGDIELNSVTEYESAGAGSVKIESASLIFAQSVHIKYQFDFSEFAGNTEDIVITLTYSDVNGGIHSSSNDFRDLTENGDYYTLTFDEIPIKDMSCPVLLSVILKGETDARQCSLMYSIESYAASKMNSSDVKLAALVKYMMAFSYEAKDYFAS